MSVEYTYLDYLAQQPGGLTDAQFYEDPDFSNRERNWFDVNWNLYALKFEHKFSEKSDFSLNLFGLDASRKAVGFRENRVSQPDDLDAPRELLVDEFKNWGAEARFLTKYDFFGEESVLLLGSKYYDADNFQKQGPGTVSDKPDFTFTNDDYPNYRRQSEYNLPNKNLAFFGENIFNLTNNFSLTPGFRIEYINTQAIGSYKRIILDLAGNPLVNETIEEDKDLKRSFALVGLGASYNLNASNELYANISQNYRSVTFSDIRIIFPSSLVDPDISEERGFTSDLGIRGRIKKYVSYDASLYGLWYNERIGQVTEIQDGFIKRKRTNVGDALIYGLETFADWDLKNTFFEEKENHRMNLFVNAAFTNSEYTSSPEPNVEGNQVEFIPYVNLKSGLNFGYKNFLAGLQYTYLSKQYTDATNAPQDVNDNQRGIEGSIPAYGILDLSASYSYGKFKLEAGINNVLDNTYFTRRATGYPGPGIIPAQPVTWYTTLQLKL